MPVVTSQPTEISYFIADITTALLTYNRIRWWRSRTGINGLFEAMTAAAAAPATILGTADTPHALNGKTLSLRINGVSDVDILFSDPDPVTTAQAVAEIIGATALVVPTDEDGNLQLETVVTGSGASIEIVESEAAPFLGLTGAAVGLDADTALVSGTHEYVITDQNGSQDFWYRAELRHTSGLTAGLSVPFQPIPAGVPASQTIVAYIRLVDFQLKPIVGRTIVIANVFPPNVVAIGTAPNINRWGVFRHNTQISTNSQGYAQVRLPRGAEVDFAVEGTNFIRRIRVPTTGDSVDLLDPSLLIQDEFGIQEPQVDFAVRTS